MYKVIVVDDEESVRQGITKHVPWNELGFEMAGDADNGEDALELAENIMPDLVITDIKMPFMDGLELTARLKSALPAAKVIVISGFDYFEYAKQAISLRITEYVLKPINIDELSAALVKAREIMEAEEASRRDLNKLKKRYDETLPMLREHLLTSLLEGRISQDRAAVLAAEYDMPFTDKFSAVACVRCEREAASGDETGNALVQLSIKQLADDVKSPQVSVRTLIYADYVVCVAGFGARRNVNEFISMMSEVCGMAEKYMDLPLFVGVGYICDCCDCLSRSYKGALAALDYRVTAGAGRAIYIDDIEPDETIDIFITSKDEQSLLSAIRLADEDTITSVVDALLSRCAESRLPYQKYQVYLLEIFTALIHIVRLNKIDIDSVFGRDFDIVRELSQMDSMESVRGKLRSLCLKASGFMRRERQNTSNMLIERAKEYAAENFSDMEFSVDGMCRELHVSPAYFSTIFKRITNASFVNYLTRLRLDEAVRMLTETDHKTHYIACAVGFSDPNYFSFVFKKRFGIPPSKYRNSLGG